MNFKTTVCVLTSQGWFEEDGIVIDMPIVPQEGSILRLTLEQQMLLEAKAKVSKNKNEYITYIGDKDNKQYLKRDINELTFDDDIYVITVNYYTDINEVTVILSSDKDVYN